MYIENVRTRLVEKTESLFLPSLPPRTEYIFFAYSFEPLISRNKCIQNVINCLHFVSARRRMYFNTAAYSVVYVYAKRFICFSSSGAFSAFQVHS